MQMLSQSNTKTLAEIKYKQRRNFKRAITITLFLLPGFVMFLVFIIYPIIQAAYASLYTWNGLGPLTKFVGLDNYTRLLGDKIFLGALWHNLLIAFFSVTLQLPFALGLALVVGRKLRGRTFFRMVFFLPFVLSDVVVGVIWGFIYNPQSGILSFSDTLNLGNSSFVLILIFSVMSWKYFGLNMVLYVAGLQQIPSEIEDAASIDGGPAQVLRHITLPLLGSTIRLTVLLSVLGSIQYFDLVWVMSQGGPVNSSETMTTYLLKYGFQRFQLGYGSAVAVVMFLICLAFSLTYQRSIMRRDLDGSTGF
jgi:raffinose/stachyose/melibiose transport system permease protein